MDNDTNLNFSAEDAKKLSDSIENERSKKQLVTIFNGIKNSANKGDNTFAFCSDIMMDNVKSHLEKLGYKVMNYSSTDESSSSYVISW